MKIKTLMTKKTDNKDILEVPFYGERGSICKIERIDHMYQVTRYGINGEEGEVTLTPVKNKGLMKNYIDDNKKYLEKNWEKYLTSLNQQPKSPLKKKKVIALSGISSAITIASGIGIIFAPEILMFLCLPTFLTSFITTCSELKKLNGIKKEEKEKKFRKQYEKITQEVNQYNINKKYNSGKVTEYSNIKQDKKANKVIGNNRIKKLEPEKLKKAS